ncbi:unnamed protein product [Heterotrigona itama]|uniref:Small ribosomal subunit protein eS17 n=1 Tax=Heterotrigona itama TaxID=395501 RepID=A0A6V7H0Z5_9HYME|nr:unnamed protein product [Heterotrigona itama]
MDKALRVCGHTPSTTSIRMTAPSHSLTAVETSEAKSTCPGESIRLMTKSPRLTKTVKKAAKLIIEKYYTRLTNDFHTNKRICEEIAIIPSKSLRNKIAGFVTHLMKRLRHSQVRGISIKLQEEERERRDNYVPEVSALEHDIIEIDPETKEMLQMLGFNNIPGLQLTQSQLPPYSRHS